MKKLYIWDRRTRCQARYEGVGIRCCCTVDCCKIPIVFDLPVAVVLLLVLSHCICCNDCLTLYTWHTT